MNVTSVVGIASKKIQAYFVALQTQSIDAGSGAGRLALPAHMFIAFKKLFFFFFASFLKLLLMKLKRFYWKSHVVLTYYACRLEQKL